MNICLISGIFPPDIGGPATYVSRLAHALREEHHHVNVVTLGDDIHEASPVPVQRISRRAPLPLRLFLIFTALLRHGRHSDVWYINGLELPAVLAGKLLRKRMIMKIVGDYAWERAMNAYATNDSIDDFQKKRQSWKIELHKILRARLARQVDTVITPSRYLKQLVHGWGVPEERIQVIYNAVEELPQNLPSPEVVRKEQGLAEHERVLITVGRLVPWKGIDGLIRALARLDKSITLWILGEGPEKDRLTELVEKLRITKQVNFLGKADRASTLAFMRAADAFVLNTGYEGFSHVLLEAMMLGTPVLTTPVCGNPELVTHQENGLLFSPGDIDMLTKQIANILSDAELNETLIQGGKRSIAPHTWKTLLQETLNVLRKS